MPDAYIYDAVRTPRGRGKPDGSLLTRKLLSENPGQYEDAAVEVLGYVSTARLVVPRDASRAPQVTISPCIVVASAKDAGRVHALCDHAVLESPVSRALGDRLQVSVDVRVVTPTEPAGVSGSGQLEPR